MNTKEGCAGVEQPNDSELLLVKMLDVLRDKDAIEKRLEEWPFYAPTPASMLEERQRVERAIDDLRVEVNSHLRSKFPELPF